MLHQIKNEIKDAKNSQFNHNNVHTRHVGLAYMYGVNVDMGISGIQFLSHTSIIISEGSRRDNCPAPGPGYAHSFLFLNVEGFVQIWCF